MITPAEALKNECEAIIQRTGAYIPPYRLTNLMKAAQKVVDTVTKADICVSYAEAMLVLRIAMGAISEVTGEDMEQ